MPSHARNSLILSNNDLARLGNIEKTPTTLLINEFKQDEEIKKIIILTDQNEKIKLLHQRVKEFLKNDDLNSAVLTLFSI